MDPEIAAAIITSGPVVLVAVVTIVVNRVFDDRRDKRQQAEAAAQRAEATSTRAEDYFHQRTERSYADRRDAIVALLGEVDSVTRRAAELEIKNYGTQYDGPPSDFLDGPDLDEFTEGLKQAMTRIDLLASPDCRAAAAELTKVASRIATEWKWEGFEEAREGFIDAARRVDLALPHYKKVANTHATSWSVAAPDESAEQPEQGDAQADSSQRVLKAGLEQAAQATSDVPVNRGDDMGVAADHRG